MTQKQPGLICSGKLCLYLGVRCSAGSARRESEERGRQGRGFLLFSMFFRGLKNAAIRTPNKLSKWFPKAIRMGSQSLSKT